MRPETALTMLLLGLLLAACSADQPVPDPKPSEPQPARPAFWNQDEYDRAMHAIFQDRQTDLSVSVQTPAGIEAQAQTARLHRHAVEDEFNNHPLKFDAEGKFTQAALPYPASMLLIELGDDFMAADAEAQGCVASIEETLRLDWYQPSQHFESVDVSINTALFDARAAASEGTRAQVTLTIPQGAKIKEVDAGLGRIAGAQLGPNRQSDFFASQTDGNTITISADLKPFFKQYLDNHSTAPKPGELYSFNGSVTLEAPAGIFAQTPAADRQDPPYTPGSYDGKVSTRNGDPYLDIPEVTPHTTITLSFVAKVKLTKEMLAP